MKLLYILTGVILGTIMTGSVWATHYSMDTTRWQIWWGDFKAIETEDRESAERQYNDYVSSGAYAGGALVEVSCYPRVRQQISPRR